MSSVELQKTQRFTCTLPVETLNAVDSIATRVGCTRSAVVAHLLSDACYQMLEVVDSVIPRSLEKAPVARRSSGRSVEELGAIFDLVDEQLKQRDVANWLSEGHFSLVQEQDG